MGEGYGREGKDIKGKWGRTKAGRTRLKREGRAGKGAMRGLGEDDREQGTEEGEGSVGGNTFGNCRLQLTARSDDHFDRSGWIRRIEGY